MLNSRLREKYPAFCSFAEDEQLQLDCCLLHFLQMDPRIQTIDGNSALMLAWVVGPRKRRERL